MNYYEVIFEDGSHSIMSGDDAAVTNALDEQHNRATNGQPGGPSGQPAARIKKVLRYDVHPQDLNEDQTVSVEVAQKTVTEALKTFKSGVVPVHELAATIRELSSPIVESGPHDSNYKMESVGAELKGVWS